VAQAFVSRKATSVSPLRVLPQRGLFAGFNLPRRTPSGAWRRNAPMIGGVHNALRWSRMPSPGALGARLGRTCYRSIQLYALLLWHPARCWRSWRRCGPPSRRRPTLGRWRYCPYLLAGSHPKGRKLSDPSPPSACAILRCALSALTGPLENAAGPARVYLSRPSKTETYIKSVMVNIGTSATPSSRSNVNSAMFRDKHYFS
jgi:hypothetical protein